jgi:parvulin-like peptidyl-prolyl isomerase
MAGKFINKPWLHFLLLGFALYVLQLELQGRQLPEIAVPSADKIAELRGQWLRSTGALPTAQQVQGLIDNEINQEILFQQALRYQWHLEDPIVRRRLIQNVRFLDPGAQGDDDELFQQALDLQLQFNDLVVRRRLIQRMEMMAYAPVRQGEVDEATLQAIYNNNLARYVQPPQVYFRQVYISRDQHQHPQQVALARKQQLLTASKQSFSSLSDPFMHGYEFKGLSEAQLARYFGADFARQLFTLADDDRLQQWLGPLASSYGQHLVWLEQVSAAQQKSFAQVRTQILAQWRREQEQLALQQLMKQLRSEYGIDAA